jgi:hypothetical protein
MPVQLPTDTPHLHLETRQYELFNRPLGQGIPRRKLYLGAITFVAWALLLLLFAVNPLSRLGPFLYVVPPFALVFFGTKLGDDGRMNLMRWYDLLLARTPRRRHRIGNPLQPADKNGARPIRIDGCVTEIHPGPDSPTRRALFGRRATNRGRR